LIFERIVIDKPIVIENIYYDYNKWNIRHDAAIELDKIVTLLTDNPQIIIELGSHTDSRGTKIYNENLSQRRAESAVQYIISKGISKDRITAKGYGEYELVNNCSDGVQCTEPEHQMNRRTEFKVTGFSEKQPVINSASK
jgi:outer membrane protein OmpA-like peptidoglycan-associated protein